MRTKKLMGTLLCFALLTVAVSAEPQQTEPQTETTQPPQGMQGKQRPSGEVPQMGDWQGGEMPPRGNW